jgi:hypothetical protein
MVLVEGEYTIEETVRVLAMGHPPSEKREIARFVVCPPKTRRNSSHRAEPLARALHGHVDFLGTGALSLKEEVRQSEAFVRAYLGQLVAKIHPYHPRKHPGLLCRGV